MGLISHIGDYLRLMEAYKTYDFLSQLCAKQSVLHESRRVWNALLQLASPVSCREPLCHRSELLLHSKCSSDALKEP